MPTHGFSAVFEKIFKSGAITWIWENPTVCGNAATLVVRGNVSLTINIVLSVRGHKFSSVVRTQ
jgi:hypothetical protein